PITQEKIDCIQRVIQADSDAIFIRFEKMNNDLKTLGGEDIFRPSYYFIYKLKSLNAPKYQFQMYVIESKSKDKEYNGTEFTHTFGSLNTGYTDEERKLATIAMNRIEARLEKNCSVFSKQK